MVAGRHPIRGFVYIGIATFFWGISASLGRAVFTGRLHISGRTVAAIDPIMLAQGRAAISCLLLLVFLLLRRGWRPLLLSKTDLLRMLWIGTLGMAASNYLYYLAIQRTNVATAITVQYTAPIWVLLYMVTRGFQKATFKRIAAVALAMLGICLVIEIFSGAGLRLDRIGIAAALLAALSFSFYNIAAHDVLARNDRWKILLWAVLMASFFWIVVNPPWKVLAADYSREQWMFLALFSLVSMLFPFSFYFAGLQHLEPTQAVIASCLEPVFSILIAAIALGEHIRAVQTLGVVLVLLAIVVIQLPEKGEPEPAVVEPIE